MNEIFEKIGIIYNSEFNNAYDIALKIQAGIKNSSIFSLENLSYDIDLAIVIGGDGSFLKSARFYSRKNIPILGFNVGRLGYLAQSGIDKLDETIEKIVSRDYKIENRLMLKFDNYTALNDIVIKGLNCTRTAALDLFINDKLLCSYVADGLIVSTPTGSTAYSLSAGGPIISPNLNCLLIIPICPHTLNTRPVIIPEGEKVLIKSHENQNLNVSCDGQVDIISKSEVKIEADENYAKLLILNQKNNFYDILREKLHWSYPFKKQ